MSYPNNPIVSLSNLYINGMNLAVTGNTTLSVLAGQCYDSSLVYPIISSNTTILNGSVNGVNGLDIGSLANNTWYAVHAISDPTLQNAPFQGFLLSLSAKSPTLPFGFGVSRRIGWVLTDGSGHFLPFLQSGNGGSRIYQWLTQIAVLSAGTATTFASQTLSAAVPPQQCPVYLNAAYVPNLATSVADIRPTGTTTAAGMCPIRYKGQVATISQSYVMSQIVPGLSSSQPSIDYQVSASDSLTLYVPAWVDLL